MGEQLKKMLNAVLPEDVVTESLLKKSQKTGITFSTLKEVFERGEYSWNASNRMTQEQFAFARVNSYIGKGKAWHMDADLREQKIVDTKLDESFSAFLEIQEKRGLWDNIHAKRKRIKHGSGERMRKPGSKGAPTTANFKSAQESVASDKRKKIELVDRPPADQAVKAKQQEIQKKIIDESGNKPYVKSFSQNGSIEHSGWKASNKHGKVKFFGKDFKASAMKHAGISEEIATSLDESFNMAWTSGIGVTLSAADCGIKIKGGFELHPDVIEQMDAIEEDVVAADKKPVYIAPRRHKDGSFGKASTAMRRTGKKIIDVPENPDVDSDEHDGK
jgi:hypothetical protein